MCVVNVTDIQCCCSVALVVCVHPLPLGQTLLSSFMCYLSVADSQHISAVKSLDGLPVHMEAKVGLGMGPRENVSSDPQHRTDQEKLAAVRQRIQLRSARVSPPPPPHTLCSHCDMYVYSIS